MAKATNTLPAARQTPVQDFGAVTQTSEPAVTPDPKAERLALLEKVVAEIGRRPARTNYIRNLCADTLAGRKPVFME